VKEKVLGVYLGVDGVGVAEFENKKLLTSVFMPYSALEAEIASYRELTDEVKAEALLQRVIRKAKAEAVKAVVSFSGRDFTFRKMDMPLLKKKELELALPLEVEKYIPFKIEDVSWAYKSKPSSRVRKTQVAFLSAKKDLIAKTESIVKNVGLEAIRLDSSVLAAADALVGLKKVNKKDQASVFIYVSEKEADITIFEDGFPTFNRYTKAPVDFEGKFNVSKFADDVRMTLEYYRREAGKAQLDRVYLVASETLKEPFAAVIGDFGIPAEVLPFESLVDKHSFKSIYELHAYALGLRAYAKPTDGYNLLMKSSVTNDKDVMSFFKAQAPEEPFDPRTSIGIVTVGLLLFVVSFFWAQALMVPIEQQKNNLISKLSENNVTVEMAPNLQHDISSLQSIHQKLKGVKIPSKKMGKFLSAFADSVSEGLWLTSISVDGNVLGTFALVLDGYVYINNPDEERKSLNTWIDRLKASKTLEEMKYTVNIQNIERGKVDMFDVTKFQVRLDPNE